MVSARIRVPRTRGRPDTLPGIRSTSSQPVQSMSLLAFVTWSRLAMMHSFLSGYAKSGPASSRSSRSAISSTPSRGCKGLHVRPEWTPPTGSLLILRASRQWWRRESRAWRSRGGCGWIPSWLPTCSPSRRRRRAWGRSVRSSWLRSPSAVSLLAVQHAEDFQVVALVAEEEPVVLGTQANQRRFDIVKLLCVPLAGLGITRQRLEDLQGDELLNAVNVCLGLPRSRRSAYPLRRGVASGNGSLPILSQSAMVKPNPARTSSFGIGGLCFNHSSASATALRSASLRVSPSSSGDTMVSSR